MSPAGPLGIYGQSKLAGEYAVADAQPDHADGERSADADEEVGVHGEVITNPLPSRQFCDRRACFPNRKEVNRNHAVAARFGAHPL